MLEEEGRPLAVYESYLEMIKNSVGSKMFQSVFVQDGNRVIDVTDKGDLACANYVSSVLSHFRLIACPFYTTVDKTLEDMILSGWVRCDTAVAGAVVVWKGKTCSDGLSHKHIGFCLDETQAVSNCPVERSPRKHGIHCLLDGKRERAVEAFFVYLEFKNR